MTENSTTENASPPGLTALAGKVRAAELRVGDRVRVRPPSEVLATLDERGAVAGMPFMPEMLGFAGRTFTVDAVVHRTCDTISTVVGTGTTRVMPGTVHLRGVRCDGSAHGGCQARCLLYWNEQWLEAATDDSPAAQGASGEVASGTTDNVPDVLTAAVVGPANSAEEPVYSCQATEVVRASTYAPQRDMGFWAKDLASRNASPATAAASFAIMTFNRWQTTSARLPARLQIRRGERWPSVSPTGERRRLPALGLQPGDLVEVKSRAEIETTLDDESKLRGLWFAPDMVPACGRRARVLAKVERIVDEKTGKMLKLRDCYILESVWCLGTYRALCRRQIYSYWREAWLRRVEPGSEPSP